MNRSLVKTLVGCLVLLPACAWSFQNIDQTIYFPSVAQGHGSCSFAPNPQFIQNDSARISGTNDSIVDFCSINSTSERINARCDNNLCQVSGNTVPSLTLSGINQFKPSSNTSTQINGCQSGQSLQVTQSNHGRIELYQACTLTFSNQTEYKVKSLTAGGGATVVLPSADYWIESLELNQGSQIIVDGDVRLFIQNSSDWTGAQINVSGSGSLTIVGYNNITLNEANQVNAYLYVGGTLTLHKTSIVNGRTTSRRLMMEGNTQINQNEQQGYACFEDDFNRSSLGQNWTPYTSTGSFTPSLISNRLRLTEDRNNQATAVTYQRIFPAAGNLVTVEFDYYAWANLTGDGADGVSVIFSDAEIIPRTGGFGGSLGYAPTISSNPIKPGFSGGWLGVGLDEWGNYSNPTEGRVGGPGFRRQAVAIRGSEAASYRYLVGTAANLNPKLDVRRTCQWWGCSFPGPGPGHRYFITIDSRNNNAVYVRVDRLVNGNMQTVIDWFNVLSNPNQGATPEEFLLSLAGSTGGSVNNHEIENFKVCALKSRDVGEQVDHFRFTLPSSDGLTCNAADVQIQACANSSCSELYLQPVTATLLPNSLPSASGGWQGGSQVNMTNGIANLKLRKNSAGNVTVGLQSSVPSAKPFSTNLCRYGSGGYSAQNCTLNFGDSGFILDVPNSYANQSVTGTIKAVRKDNASQLCLPSFQNIQKPVSFWSDYLSPNGGQGFSALSVGVNSVAVGQSSNTATPVVLNFNQNGEASINVSYREAGSLALNARLTGSGDEQDLQLTGQTTFIRVPRALVLRTDKRFDATPPDGQCLSADTSCTVFARAGEVFDLNIKAVAAEPNEDNDFTNNLGLTNYQQQSITLDHVLREPASGSAGSIGTLNYDHELGEVTTVQQSVTEVGVFDFLLAPPTSYLGLDLTEANLPISVASTGSIGRFTPYYLHLEGNTPSFSQACSTFTYLGQAMKFDRLPEISVAGRFYDELGTNGEGETENYKIGSWWRYSNPWLYRNFSAQSSGFNITDTETPGLLNPQEGFAWPGSVVIDTSNFIARLENAQIRYDKPYAPVEPIAEGVILQLSIDDTKDLDGVCYQTSGGSGCIGYDFPSSESQNQRWGKLVIHDTYGPETSGLSQPITSEYFTSNSFVLNKADSCTSLPTIDDFVFNSSDFTVLKNGTPIPPEVKVTLAGDLSSGVSSVDYTPPGSANTGVVVNSYDLSTLLPWLRVDADSNDSFEDSISGRVQFGLYRGSDRVIWWREKN